MRFIHETLPQRVVFAPRDASSSLAVEVERLGATRLMVIAGQRGSALARTITEGLPIALWHDEVVMHVPVEVANRARVAAAENHVDAVVSIGGGSATGLAKAVALTTGLPILAVPTTYAGSEATDVWGLTSGVHKSTGRDARVLPRAVIYDAELTFGLPRDIAIASGLNALAHCVDSLWAPKADPINTALAVQGVRALAAGLPLIAQDPTGISGREQTLYGAYLAAVAFASAGSGLHHKICHVLGGRYDLPHAQMHSVVLPYVLAFNAPNAPAAADQLKAAFGSATALSGLQSLRKTLDAPLALRDYGFSEADLPDATAAVLLAVPPSNPTAATTENISALLRAALEGTEPS
ncbi:maleylacetate reductase [Rhodococcus sp. UFZ-B548]|uniref:maleylacetate reductase n=1 Tax=Rhodococcus sp. UFZ-B548 TaxID=2742212 RepID=UPI0015F7054F|nr:maleylacetate reductase [Rhodococcus sp. UFZ-B548]